MHVGIQYKAIMLYGIEIDAKTLDTIRREEEDGGYTSDFSWEDPERSWKKKHVGSDIMIKIIGGPDINTLANAYVCPGKLYFENELHVPFKEPAWYLLLKAS